MLTYEPKLLIKKDQFIKHKAHRKSLTVCIATICEADTNTPKIVFCADRMLTDQYGYTFELQRPKIVQLAKHCLVMEAGDVPTGDKVLQRFFKRVPLDERDSMKVSEIAHILAEEFSVVYNESLEQAVFKPKGVSKADFYENQKNFREWFSIVTYLDMVRFDLYTSFIILGIDIDQDKKRGFAHLYELSRSGTLDPLDEAGFAIAGIGAHLSIPEYTKDDKFSKDIEFADAIVRTYWAKRVAERMSGVGMSTDLGVLQIEKDKETGNLICKDRSLENIRDGLKSKFDDIQKNTKNIIASVTNDTKTTIINNPSIALLSTAIPSALE